MFGVKEDTMKKNKKLLIIVSCLLLVGGISFAYFIASTIFSGEGSNVGGTTATIKNSTCYKISK